MVIAETKEELELVLDEIKILEKYSLVLNVKKSQIMSNHKDMSTITEVRGIKVTDNIKYLGVLLYCDR